MIISWLYVLRYIRFLTRWLQMQADQSLSLILSKPHRRGSTGGGNPWSPQAGQPAKENQDLGMTKNGNHEKKRITNLQRKMALTNKDNLRDSVLFILRNSIVQPQLSACCQSQCCCSGLAGSPLRPKLQVFDSVCSPLKLWLNGFCGFHLSLAPSVTTIVYNS